MRRVRRPAHDSELRAEAKSRSAPLHPDRAREPEGGGRVIADREGHEAPHRGVRDRAATFGPCGREHSGAEKRGVDRLLESGWNRMETRSGRGGNGAEARSGEPELEIGVTRGGEDIADPRIHRLPHSEPDPGLGCREHVGWRAGRGERRCPGACLHAARPQSLRCLPHVQGTHPPRSNGSRRQADLRTLRSRPAAAAFWRRRCPQAHQ